MLKRLELIGFKSFAAKTTLDFPNGITAIVGPNGSGKSNLIDAMRWLLGERDAKNLRGAKAEDLVFAGTPKKPRVGLAQASIYFDNSSSFFPIEFAEVAVGREVSRSGDSKYFLNKSEVRLRDLIDFFAKVRLGAKGLTVIGQGASDIFLRATPKERREMIEEILGLREYQLKKLEAERRHKNTLLNLDKVRALVDEISPHLKILKKQTAKWARRSEIEAELRNLEHYFFGAKLVEINVNFGKIDPQIAALDRDIAGKNAELKKLQEAVGVIEKNEPEKHAELKKMKDNQAQLLEKRSGLEKELGRLEARLEFASQRPESEVSIDVKKALEVLKNIRERLAKFDGFSLEEMRSLANGWLTEINGLFKAKKTEEFDKDELAESKEKIVTGLEELNKEIALLHSRELEISKVLESQNTTFRKAVEAVEEKKNEIHALEASKNKLLFERERWSLRHEDLQAQVVQAGINFNDFKNHSTELMASQAAVFASVTNDELERKILRFRGELASIGDVDEVTLKEATDTEERYNFLTTQSADLEKALHDLINLKNELEEKIDKEFTLSLSKINEEFSKLFELMFGGGRAKLKLKSDTRQATREKSKKEKGEEMEKKTEVLEEEEEKPEEPGIDIEVSIPRKRITGLEMLSGGERSLVSIAALFSLVAVSPPPFLVLDEIDAALDECNARRFAEMLKDFSKQTQFVVVTHNRATMEVADVLYGVTMGEDGTSRVLSLKLEDAPVK